MVISTEMIALGYIKINITFSDIDPTAIEVLALALTKETKRVIEEQLVQN